MKLGMALVAGLAILLAFQNCSKDLGQKKTEGTSQAAGNPSPTPSPGPSPSQLPAPTPGGQVQPASSNSMTDVKPYNAMANCANGYGVYSMLNTTPAIASTWNHQLCVKPYAVGDASVISDVELVTGSACPAGELLATIAGGGPDFTTPKFSMNYTICIKRQNVPVTSSFVTYFYMSAPNANCRTGDIANGSAIFCSTANSAGTCQGMVTVKLCKSIQ